MIAGKDPQIKINYIKNMNKTKKDKIDWADYTWNPITGCANNCTYCYAKGICSRFHKQWEKKPHELINAKLDKPFDPKLWPDRLKEKMPKKPSKIFIGSMAGMFESQIPNCEIENILKVVRNNPQHTFQFLTKNPKRYLDFDFPENCWLGTTVDYPNQDRVNWLKKKNNYKFISFEPLLDDMSGLDISDINLVIIGAMTGRGSTVPKKEWINSIRHPNIIYKNNIKKYL